MPAPTPTMIVQQTLDLYDGVPALIRSYNLLADKPADIELDYKLVQGYDQNIATVVGTGQVKIVPLQFDVEVETAGGGGDLPAQIAQLRADLVATRQIRITVGGNEHTLTVSLGSKILNQRKWGNGGQNRRVTIEILPTTITSTGTGGGDGLV